MKTDWLVKIKNIFMYITLIWSSVMLALYSSILFELPLFSLISGLPFGEFISVIFELLLYLGIWAVPVLYIITIVLMMQVSVRYNEENKNRVISVITIVLPLVLLALMLLSGFNELLQ